MIGNNIFVVDAHTHFTGVIYPQTEEERKARWGLEQLIADMDKCGVDVAAVSSFNPMLWFSWHKSELGGNEEVAEAIRNYSKRIIGMFVPRIYADEDYLSFQIETAVKRYGFKGLKIHPWCSDIPPNAKTLQPIYEAAAKFRMPVQFHSGTAPYATPLLIAEVARSYPEIPVIMGHMGKQDLWLDVIPASKLSENIYVDTSGQCIRALIEKFVEEIGPHRILFASDWPGLYMNVEIQRIMDCDMEDKHKRMILGENAAKLFGISRDSLTKNQIVSRDDGMPH